MEKRPFGSTGLMVSPLAFGSSELRGVEPAQSSGVLEAALDAGVNVIDTAECYRDAEEKIGASIARRRGEFVLVSKCGHQVADDEPPAWSPQLVRQSAERSLRRLRTDHLDVLLLHSCAAKELGRQDLLDALAKCKRDGLTRFIGFSGDREAAELAARTDIFDCLETSVSIADQHVLTRHLPQARARGMAVMAKRSIANTAWRFLEDPTAASRYVRAYADRLVAMGFTPQSLGFDGSWVELALRFTAWQEGVHTAIVGITTVEHLLENIRSVRKGPLPPHIVQSIRQIWNRHDDGSWVGES